METARKTSLFPVLYSIPILVAAGLALLMLATDSNLRTDFGQMSSGYFSHWYVILALAIADLVGVGLLLAMRNRTAVKLCVVGSGLSVLVLLGAILTYSQVGFASAGDMANYLFGITYYGNDIRYLYDALLATTIATFAIGVAGLAATREKAKPNGSHGDGGTEPT